MSAEDRAAVIAATAAIMSISPEAVEVYRIYAGSIIFDLGVPGDAVERLRTRVQSNIAHLRLLKVQKVILERQSEEIEEWIFEEGKFHLVTSPHSPISNGKASNGKSQRNILTSLSKIYRSDEVLMSQKDPNHLRKLIEAKTQRLQLLQEKAALIRNIH